MLLLLLLLKGGFLHDFSRTHDRGERQTDERTEKDARGPGMTGSDLILFTAEFNRRRRQACTNRRQSCDRFAGRLAGAPLAARAQYCKLVCSRHAIHSGRRRRS